MQNSQRLLPPLVRGANRGAACPAKSPALRRPRSSGAARNGKRKRTGWPDFGEGRPGVVLWRRPVSMHIRRSGGWFMPGRDSLGAARPCEAPDGSVFLRRGLMPTANSALRRAACD
jgi:hypothetical protein